MLFDSIQVYFSLYVPKYVYILESNIKDLKKKISYLGGWSLLDPNWKEKDFSVVKFYSKSMEIGYLSKSLFEIDTEMNTENRQNIIAVR